MQNINPGTKRTVVATAGVILCLAGLISALMSSPTKGDIARATVMITNLSSNSGGSGTIISSSTGKSKVLTNSHVCEVTANGGLVHTGTGSYAVVAYQQSTIHDLCLITVAADLEAGVPLASSSPPNLAAATVSGHPQLYPIVINHGHFSGSKIIMILTGVDDCAPEDFSDPDLGMFCVLLGKKPRFKAFESRLVTALIQPGSSGSAVYNDRNEISAVVFAGSSGIGYAFTVPFEYVQTFLTEEVRTIPEKAPSMNPLAGKSNHKQDFEAMQKICNDFGSTNKICNTIMDTFVK